MRLNELKGNIFVITFKQIEPSIFLSKLGKRADPLIRFISADNKVNVATATTCDYLEVGVRQQVRGVAADGLGLGHRRRRRDVSLSWRLFLEQLWLRLRLNLTLTLMQLLKVAAWNVVARFRWDLNNGSELFIQVLLFSYKGR